MRIRTIIAGLVAVALSTSAARAAEPNDGQPCCGHKTDEHGDVFYVADLRTNQCLIMLAIRGFGTPPSGIIIKGRVWFRSA